MQMEAERVASASGSLREDECIAFTLTMCVAARTQVELLERGNQSASPAKVEDAGAQRFHPIIAEVVVRESDARAEWVLRVAAEDLAGVESALTIWLAASQRERDFAASEAAGSKQQASKRLPTYRHCARHTSEAAVMVRYVVQCRC